VFGRVDVRSQYAFNTPKPNLNTVYRRPSLASGWLLVAEKMQVATICNHPQPSATICNQRGGKTAIIALRYWLLLTGQNGRFWDPQP
jgi:hypothetical protein